MRNRTRILGAVFLFAAGYVTGMLAHERRQFPAPQIERAVRKGIGLLRPAHGKRPTEGRERIPCPSSGDGTAVLLTLGQSNSANHGEPGYRAGPRVSNFNVFDGHCYAARDPLLGATGDGGSPWTRLGDKLIEAGLFSEVLVAPIGVGGTGIASWAPGGHHNPRIALAKRTLDAAGLRVTHVFWHQGETDARNPGVDYVEQFRGVLRTIREVGIDAPVYVAVASICQNRGSDEIRRAQREIARTLPGVLSGPNTDALDRLRWRIDGCHFSAEGLDRHADLWLEVLSEPIGPPR